MQPYEAVIAGWTNAAPYWEKHFETIAQMFAPVTQALVEDAGVASGHTVLDIATGPGEPALTLAGVVGAEGKVVGVDVIPGMVAAGRRSAERKGLRNVQFEVASADRLPLSNDTFDAVISRFGVMFFPSPLDGIREMLRVLKPGGKLALAVWYAATENPFLQSVSKVVDRYLALPPAEPDAPEPFRFAAPGKLLQIFKQAGVVSSTERLLQFRIEAPVSAEEFCTLRCEMSDTLREKLKKLSAEQLTTAMRESIEALAEYCTDGKTSFPGQVLIVSGWKART